MYQEIFLDADKQEKRRMKRIDRLEDRWFSLDSEATQVKEEMYIEIVNHYTDAMRNLNHRFEEIEFEEKFAHEMDVWNVERDLTALEIWAQRVALKHVPRIEAALRRARARSEKITDPADPPLWPLATLVRRRR